jgi:hypothetical protein
MTFNVRIAKCLCQQHTQNNGRTLNKQRVLIEGSTKVLLPASSFSGFGAAHYRLCVSCYAHIGPRAWSRYYLVLWTQSAPKCVWTSSIFSEKKMDWAKGR